MNEQELKKLTKKDLIRLFDLQDMRIASLKEQIEEAKKKNHLSSLSKLPKGSFSDYGKIVVDILRLTEALSEKEETQNEST